MTSRNAPLPERGQRVWMTFSGDFRKRGSKLMQQQCWCWGFDVRRQQAGIRSNLLLEWGFERTPPPADHAGATTYQRHENDGTVVTLWGFGMCFGDEHGGIFLPRFNFIPRLGSHHAPEHAHSLKGLEDYRAPKTESDCQSALRYFERALLWIGNYESRVLEELGRSYRSKAIADWGHSAPPPQEVPRRWNELALESRTVVRFWHFENGKKRQIKILNRDRSEERDEWLNMGSHEFGQCYFGRLH